MFEYQFTLDRGNPNFESNEVINNMLIQARFAMLNNWLEYRGWVFLREVQEQFCIPMTKTGVFAGWRCGCITYDVKHVYENDKLVETIVTTIVDEENILDVLED